MASPLTATGVKSSLLYLFILVFFVLSFFYLWFLESPTIQENTHANALNMSYKAFKNSIFLARVKFLSRIDQDNFVDIWRQNGTGLDYNQAGYPIGTEALKSSLEAPITVGQCIDIWNFLMRLQPVTTSPQGSRFWAKVEKNSICTYQLTPVKDQRIIYNPALGTVKIEQVTY